ncbi:MAG: response regulator [Calditrichaeota bacterium]|nr:MAG: response regulator [Calditrichota bacterium]MBL1207780.1 response regulator [Calditrichota bacterium]NOG47613.1 response regulator [Calditrichota bacterium]
MKSDKINLQIEDLLEALPDNFEPDEDFLAMLERLNIASNKSQIAQTNHLNNLYILDSLPNPAFILNQSRLIKRINKVGEEVFGYENEELENLFFSDLFIDEVICDFFLSELPGNVNLSGVEVELRNKKGDMIPFLLSGSALNIENETVFICVVQDISEIKRHHEKLYAAKLKADESNKAKSEFLANMSHEIRTPLNGVIGLNNLILDTELTEEQEEYSKSIRFSADSLLRLLNDILDLSKIEAGKIDFEVFGFSPVDLVQQVCSIFELQANEKGIVIKTEIDAGVADILFGDMARIRQIIVNLVGNAIKFTEEGSITIGLLLHDEQDDKQTLKFSVRDTGIGISVTKQKHIFESFSQADASTTRKYGGTGLGLSICRKLVWLMKGEMNVFSREGHGSNFWFTIPFKVNVENKQLIEKTEKENSLNIISGLHILLVEDNLINQKVAKRLLTNNSFKVDVANNGQQAVDMFIEKKYDLILMDLQMPVMDGLTASRKIREFDDDIPIIALTANAMKGDEEMCLEAGMNGYTTKPIKKNELFDIINNLTFKEIELEL